MNIMSNHKFWMVKTIQNDEDCDASQDCYNNPFADQNAITLENYFNTIYLSEGSNMIRWAVFLIQARMIDNPDKLQIFYNTVLPSWGCTKDGGTA